MGEFETMERLTQDEPAWIEIPVEQENYNTLHKILSSLGLTIDEAVEAYLARLVTLKDQIFQDYQSGVEPSIILTGVADRVLCDLIAEKRTGGKGNV